MSRDIRVVVPCYNADPVLERCLEGIFSSAGIDFEVVIVDDGNNSTLATLAAIHPITIVKTSGRLGAGAARNLGAAGFTGSVLVFIDADVQVGKKTIFSLAGPITSGRADAAVGRYSSCVRGRRAAEAYKQLYCAYTYSRPKRELRNTFWTALGAVRTECFNKVNGFETTYRGAGPEDIGLGIKLTALHAKILPIPEAVGDHLASRGMMDLIRNDYRKGCEDVYIHWKKAVPLTDNRHAGALSIMAVVCAWLVPVSFAASLGKSGLLPVLIVVTLYGASRTPLLLKGYLPSGLKMFFIAIPVTYLLDSIRGAAVIAGTLFAIIDGISPFTRKPFTHVDGEPQS